MSQNNPIRPPQPPIPGLIVEIGDGIGGKLTRTIARVEDNKVWSHEFPPIHMCLTERWDAWQTRPNGLRILSLPPPAIGMHVWYDGCERRIIAIHEEIVEVETISKLAAVWFIPHEYWTIEYVVVLSTPKA